MITQSYINEISYEIIGCAIEVHKHLGPGLLESVYHSCLLDELEDSGLNVQSQAWVPIHYKGKAQLLSYLKLAKKPKGLLINFNSESIRSQIISLATDQFAKLEKI